MATKKQIYDLNNMNVAAQNVQLGTIMGNMGTLATFGRATVDGDRVNANTVVKFTQASGAINGYIVNAFLVDGTLVTTPKVTIVNRNVLTITDTTVNLPIGATVNAIIY